MRKKKGGKILGKGSYGVAFTPALACDAYPQQPGTVGKVFLSEKIAESTWKLSEKLKMINGYHKYFGFSTVRCVIPSQQVIVQEPSIRDLFTQRKVKGGIPATFQQHIMKHGGIGLYTYMRTFYIDEKISRVGLVRLLENLFYAVRELQKHKYVHQDIKPQNVIISNKDRLRLIDFDLMFHLDNFYNTDLTEFIKWKQRVPASQATMAAFQQYSEATGFRDNFLLENTKNDVTPPEYMLYSHDFGRTSVTLDDFLDYHAQKSYIEFFTHYNKKAHEDEINNFISEVKTIFLSGGPIAVQEYWRKNNLALKSDVYSIGKLILDLYGFLAPSQSEPNDILYYTEDRYGPKVSKVAGPNTKQINVKMAFHKLMSGLLWMNPKNRFTIQQAIRWMKLIKEFDSKDPYKENKDDQSLLDDMKSKRSDLNGSVSNTVLRNWRRELQSFR
jgi:serine/threonine protein kinase